jgi:WD40 repeat protein
MLLPALLGCIFSLSALTVGFPARALVQAPAPRCQDLFPPAVVYELARLRVEADTAERGGKVSNAKILYTQVAQKVDELRRAGVDLRGLAFHIEELRLDRAKEEVSRQKKEEEVRKKERSVVPEWEVVWEENLGGVLTAALSPDQTTLVVGDDKGKVRIIDLTTRRERAMFDTTVALSQNREKIIAFAFAPDSRAFATAHFDNTIKLWSVDQPGHLVRTFQLPKHNAVTLNFSPDGTKLITGDNNNDAVIFDVSMGSVIHFLKGHTNTVTAAVFSIDGSEAYTSATQRPNIKVWDVATGNLKGEIFGPMGASKLIPLRDRTHLVSLEESDKIRVRRLSSGDEAAGFPAPAPSSWIKDLNLSPDETWAIAALADGSVVILNHGVEVKKIDPPARTTPWTSSRGEQMNFASFIVDHMTFVTASAGGVLRIWSAPK